MPSKKKKYNARFPAGRIKKIMQTDEEVGKVAQAVPVIISRTLELFVGSLLTKSISITQSRSAKTLTPSHMKQCILSENRFDFLKDLVKEIPDASTQEDNENNTNEALDYTLPRNHDDSPAADDQAITAAQKPGIAANFYTEQSTSTGRTPVIRYSPKVTQPEASKLSFSVENLVKQTEPKVHIDLSHLSDACGVKPPIPVPEFVPAKGNRGASPSISNNLEPSNDVPPLIPLAHNYYGQSTGDNLYIDEDYDN